MDEWLSPILKIVFGLASLIAGGELLVRGATRLAAAMKISPLVIGLTVVAFGTSSPELAVSVQSAFAGNADIALGNVVGSNIFNVLFILGLSALIVPLVVSSRLIRWDVPLMIVASVLLLLLGLDGRIGRLDGLLLFSGLLAYTFWCVRQSRRESSEVKAEFAQEMPVSKASRTALLVQIGFIIGGLILLGLGSRWLVGGSVFIATRLGVSELIIGLTIIAAGTSLPEVVTSIMAAWRGERDIAVGNVVGSNLFNILCVLGLTGAIAPSGVAISPDGFAIRHSRDDCCGRSLPADILHRQRDRSLGRRPVLCVLHCLHDVSGSGRHPGHDHAHLWHDHDCLRDSADGDHVVHRRFSCRP